MNRRIIAATVLGSSMAFIDSTAVNVAIPLLQRDLHASLADVQWVIESYQLLLASLILVGGALGDHYGRRRIFSFGVFFFALTSAWCGISPNASMLIAARLFQGAAGALLVPSSLAIISASFNDEERGKAIGLWSSLTSLTIILGPVLGGWLADHFSWRWLFFINLPIALVTLLLTRGINETRESRARGLDWFGATLITLALAAVAYGWTEWRPGDPMAMMLTLTAIAVILGIAFVLWERRAAEPMMPLSIFASRPFSMANALTLLLYAALGGAMFFLPFNLIGVQNYSATRAGAANLPLIVLLTLLSPLSGKWASRRGWRGPLIIGPTLAAAGFALLTRPGPGASYWRDFFPALLVLGLGMAITVAPLTTAVMSSVSRDRAGVASGINNAVARAAGLLAIAVLGAQVAGTFSGMLGRALAARGTSPQVVQKIVAQKAKLTDIELPALAPDAKKIVRGVIDEAFLRAFRAAMLSCAALALGAAICGAFTGSSDRPRDDRR